MRVLCVGNMYPPHHLGGYELLWESSVRHLRARGHEVRVLTTDFCRPGAGAGEDRDVHRTLRWYWRDHEFPRRRLRERLELERHNASVLDGHLAALRPDVVSWWAMGGMSTSLIERVRRRGLPAVGVVGDDWMLYGPHVDAWMRVARRLPVRSVAGVPARFAPRRAGRWVFISQAVREPARRRWRLTDTEVRHPGVDPRRFAARPPDPWSWRLACLGRIDPRKGLATAVQALAELPAEATLTVDGEGDERHRDELRELSGRLGVAERVRFTRTAHAGVPAAYARADAVLFPVVWSEPWGLVPLEAMAVGRPVVATGLGGSGEYLRDGENCLLVAPGDARALAGAVRRLASDPDLRERLRTGGAATARRFHEAAFHDAVERAHLAAREAA